jgi:hypothetical protein
MIDKLFINYFYKLITDTERHYPALDAPKLFDDAIEDKILAALAHQ